MNMLGSAFRKAFANRKKHTDAESSQGAVPTQDESEKTEILIASAPSVDESLGLPELPAESDSGLQPTIMNPTIATNSNKQPSSAGTGSITKADSGSNANTVGEPLAPISATMMTQDTNAKSEVAFDGNISIRTGKPLTAGEVRSTAKGDVRDRIAHIPSLGHSTVSLRGQMAEEFRVLRTNINSLELPEGRNSLMITSCHHSEGKTWSSGHLALSLARNRSRKVILIDCDLRRPRIKEFFNRCAEYDLVDFLTGRCSLEDIMVYSEADNLTVVFAKRDYSNATDYLEMDRMQEFIDYVHYHFDLSLFDSPPVLSTADPCVLGPRLGAAMLLVRSRRTQREAVQYGIQVLEQAGTSMAGIALTFVRFVLPPFLYYYQNYRSYYYYYDDLEKK